MFAFNEIKTIQIEITNRCQASCPMCLRNINGGIDNPLLVLNDWTLQEFKNIFIDEVLDQVKTIEFCGVYGDPLLNNDLIEMCHYVSTTNPKVTVAIHTNGSVRNIEWWEHLAKVLPSNHKINFAIDGLEDTHSIYRIGTNFKKIIENAKAFISAGGIANWIFIKFKHNEHQVQQAEKLSKELGFNEFTVKQSKRFGDKFPVLDKAGNVTYYIEQFTNSNISPVRFVDIADYKSWPNKIKCFTLEEKETYIDAHGHLLPCCLIASFLYANYDVALHESYGLIDEDSVTSIAKYAQDEVYALINEFGGFDALDTKKHSIKEIMNNKLWQELVQHKWTENASTPCTILCSDNSKFITIAEQKIYQS
jgi:Radical SAM superfamily/4Fe-4S single cluster domain